MLIFHEADIKVYACSLVHVEERSGMRYDVERAGVRSLLREAFGNEVEAVAHTLEGAPYLPGRSESISVSHCRGLAVLAVSSTGAAIGVDAESVGRGVQLKRVMRRFLCEAQISEWGTDESQLLRAWTIKEALYKAAGIVGWALVDIPLPPESSRQFECVYVPCPITDDVIITIVKKKNA